MMRIGNWRITADWGHLVFITFVVGFVVWYLISAINISGELYNLILITPCAIAIVVLYGVLLVEEVSITGCDKYTDESTDETTLSLTVEHLRIAAVMALVSAYVACIEWLGFEIASFLFIYLTLLVLGERRFVRIAIFASIFSLFTTWAVVAAATFAIPTRLF
jgi:hypothetical protein